MAVGRLKGTFQTLMDRVPGVIAAPEPSSAGEILKLAATGAAGALAPVVFAAMGLAIVGGVAQGGLKISSKRFKPKFEQLNIGKGVKRWFSLQSAWTLAKTLMKFAVIGGVAWQVLGTAQQRTMGNGALTLSTAVAAAGESSLSMIRVAASVGLVIAALDYMFERRRVNKGMMMSRDEIKREYRQSEGDPLQKGELRKRQRQLSSNRMMADVANADVVIVNPTEIAVALKYEPGAGAPTVVAKGAGLIAARIREEAQKHDLPMVADIPLARLLYADCEIGQAIPVEVYDAVARVLAFVMSLRRRGSVMTGVHTVPRAMAGR
jgi:flagellar biosynthetic protein FlhB